MGKVGPPANAGAQELYYQPHKDSAEARFGEMRQELRQMEAELHHAQNTCCSFDTLRWKNDRVWKKRVDLMWWSKERWGSFKW